MTDPRLTRVAETIDRWTWMPRYIALRLADPQGSPLAAMARARAETEDAA